MAYIIENANILKRKELKTCSLFIQDNRIASIQSNFKYYRHIKMDLEPYIMSPSFVLLNSNIPLKNSFQDMKKWMIDYFLSKGSTTLFTYVQASFAEEIPEKINELKVALSSSSIDYLIGVKIPMRLITPSMIRKCKKEKVPAIFVDLDNPDELASVPWGWIREALFPYNCPLIPIFSSTEKKEAKAVLSKWLTIMEKEKIPALLEELEENIPLSATVLNKIGLFPHKGSLMNGTELSYNLYGKSREIINVDEAALFHYYGDRLAITVHKGKIVRSGKEVLFKPGYGEYVKVRTPSFFSL